MREPEAVGELLSVPDPVGETVTLELWESLAVPVELGVWVLLGVPV